jgi:hypothetical protein
MLQAISGPLADRHPGVDRTVAVFLALALGFEVSVEVVADDLVRAARWCW